MEKSFYLDFIARQNSNQTVIYVTVGCAAHQIQKIQTNNNNEDHWILPENVNQEYPLFLQILKLRFPRANLHIFMIDPLLEDIPFVITNNDKKTLKNNWYQINNEMFYNKNENTTIYAIKDNMIYPYDKFVENKKYNVFFEKLNNYAKQLDWTVFLCDFSGRRIRDSAIYFEEELKNHLDHIIYGFFADDEETSTCIIDTTSSDCLYVLSEDNNKIKVFNPYMYNDNYFDELPNFLHKLNHNANINKKDIIIATTQIKNFLRDKKRHIRDIIYALRAVYIGIQKKEIINDYHIARVNILADKYKFKFYENFDENSYQSMFDNLKETFFNEIEKYARIIFFDDTKELINERYHLMMKEKNVYNWENHFKDLLIDFDNIF